MVIGGQFYVLGKNHLFPFRNFRLWTLQLLA
jgi:hypothetical protein